ncbi:MAG: hypothetical protein AAFV88_14895, partial [Planctomycetota bacterium]
FDANDQFSEAFFFGSISQGQTYSTAEVVAESPTETIDLPDDVDVYRFDAVEGQEFSVALIPTAGSHAVRIWGPSPFGDDSPVPFNTFGPDIIGEGTVNRLASRSGAYYVSVSEVANTSYNPTTGSGFGSPFASLGPYTIVVGSNEDPPGVTQSTIGLYQPDASLFHLKNSFTPGPSDQYFAFGPTGNAGWLPLSGDWDGDGVDTIGFYQPDISLFHLKDSFTPGASDQYFRFGPSGSAGWIPIAGDWDGDGVDTIGLYQPDLSLFHLKDSFTPGASDQYFVFGPGGNAGWIPLSGDWDGDGRDTIGLYQPDQSLFHLKNAFTPGAADVYFAFGPGGNAGWTPLSGDWNANGIDTVGFYEPGASLFHLKDSFTPGQSDQYFRFGPSGNAGWIPLTGDWNGPNSGASGRSAMGRGLRNLARPEGELDDSLERAIEIIAVSDFDPSGINLGGHGDSDQRTHGSEILELIEHKTSNGLDAMTAPLESEFVAFWGQSTVDV